VLDPPAEEQPHTRIGVRRGELGDLPEGVEALRELTEHDGGTHEQLWSEGELLEPDGHTRSNRIVREGLLACEEVLMDPNPIGTVAGYGAEGHGAIPIPDDDDLPCGCFLDGRSCLCQDEPVSRVDRHEVVTRDVGKSSQDLEVEGVVHRRQPAIASIER